MERKAENKRAHDKALMALAVFKWFKALVLFLVGIGFLKLMHHDIETTVLRWLNEVRVDPDNRHLGAFLGKLNLLNDKKIEALGALTFAYSALFLVEGTGLFFEKRWAKYLTIVATISFIPIEIYELVTAATVLKFVALVINIAIAVFLMVNVRSEKRSS